MAEEVITLKGPFRSRPKGNEVLLHKMLLYIKCVLLLHLGPSTITLHIEPFIPLLSVSNESD